jgi:hypothetical protein
MCLAPQSWQLSDWSAIMELYFLGKETTGGDSPTLYATNRGTYVIQGWVVTDPEILAKLDAPDRETCVEVCARLFTHLAKDGPSGVVSTWAAPIVHVLPSGNYIVQGARVADAEVRAKMAMPVGEDCVEVSQAALAGMLQEGDDLGVDDTGAA